MSLRKTSALLAVAGNLSEHGLPFNYKSVLVMLNQDK